MRNRRFFLRLFAWSALPAALTVFAVFIPVVGLFIHWIAACLVPAVLASVALVQVPCRTPRRAWAAFTVVFLYTWAMFLLMAAGWGLLLDLFSLPIFGGMFGSGWGGIVWASSDGGGRIPGVFVLPLAYGMYGWVIALVVAAVFSVRRFVRKGSETKNTIAASADPANTVADPSAPPDRGSPNV